MHWVSTNEIFVFLSFSLPLYSIRLFKTYKHTKNRYDVYTTKNSCISITNLVTYIQTKTVAFQFPTWLNWIVVITSSGIRWIEPKKTQLFGGWCYTIIGSGSHWCEGCWYWLVSASDFRKKTHGVLAQVTCFFWLEALSNMLPRWCSSARGCCSPCHFCQTSRIITFRCFSRRAPYTSGSLGLMACH